MEIAPIFIHGRELTSVFELLGSRENNITYSVGWALSHAPSFRSLFSQRIGLAKSAFDEVRLQESGNDGGFTDIELLGDHAHAIIEAKRGWWLPTAHQFEKYAPRLNESARLHKRLVAMTDCSAAYAAAHHLPPDIEGSPLCHVAWRDVEALCDCGQTHAEKRLLTDLRSYLRSVATMQATRSNMVYVVALNGNAVRPGASTTFIDVVEQHHKYFHPVGHRYPKEPPNYIGFRYGGELRSIHHIDSFVVTSDVGEEVPGCRDVVAKGPHPDIPHYVYTLGPAIKPHATVKSGPIRDRRIWAAIDLLLTSKNLVEAESETKKRDGMPSASSDESEANQG
jgi:hypothetical protein